MAWKSSQPVQWFPAFRTTTIRAGLAAIAVLFSAALASGELLELAVREADGKYSLRIVVLMDAPADYVHHVVTDYRNAYRINPAITSVKILPTKRVGVTRVTSRSTHRVGLFAFEIEWAGDVMERGQERIEMTTVPEFSSFESGFSLWEICPQGQKTRLLHESTLKPKFFVPPLVGTYLVKKHMKHEALATFHRIECHARTRLERDMQEGPEALKVVLKRERDCREAPGYEESRGQKRHERP